MLMVDKLMNEKISQLVDEELGQDLRQSAIDEIIENDQACMSWKRYHLIGNVIRDEVSTIGRDLSGQIEKQLENKPTVLAPLTIKSPKSAPNFDVWKSAGMFAIAASLVLVAVITLNPLGTSDQKAGQRNQIANNVGNNGEEAVSQKMSRFSQEFDEMLVEHGEFTASPGLNGLVAYAKLVSSQQLEQ